MTTRTQQAPQQLPAATNQIYQPALGAAQTQTFANDLNQFKYKRILRVLAIAELILGSICVFLTIIIVVTMIKADYRYVFENIWCGVWIIVAGAFGVRAAKINSSRRMINCHLAFSIVGAVFSAVLFSRGIYFAVKTYEESAIIAFSVSNICSFSSMVLLIISASYCYGVNGCCTQVPEYNYSRMDEQVIHPPNTVPGHATDTMQVYQPTMPGAQSGYVQQSAVNQTVPQFYAENQGQIISSSNLSPPY